MTGIDITVTGGSTTRLISVEDIDDASDDEQSRPLLLVGGGQAMTAVGELSIYNRLRLRSGASITITDS
jgi:hypothetical protein